MSLFVALICEEGEQLKLKNKKNLRHSEGICLLFQFGARNWILWLVFLSKKIILIMGSRVLI